MLDIKNTFSILTLFISAIYLVIHFNSTFDSYIWVYGYIPIIQYHVFNICSYIYPDIYFSFEH